MNSEVPSYLIRVSLPKTQGKNIDMPEYNSFSDDWNESCLEVRRGDHDPVRPV